MTSPNTSQSQQDQQPLTLREFGNDMLRRFVVVSTMGASSLANSITRVLPPDLGNDFPKTPPSESEARAFYEIPEIESRIDEIIVTASGEILEDGMDSKTALVLNRFVREHPVAGMHQLSIRINSPETNLGVAADIVRALGRIEHERTLPARAYIAESLLYSSLPLARDAGSVALSDLAYSGSFPALQAAVERETIPALKSDMQISLDELTAHANVVHSKET